MISFNKYGSHLDIEKHSGIYCLKFWYYDASGNPVVHWAVDVNRDMESLDGYIGLHELVLFFGDEINGYIDGRIKEHKGGDQGCDGGVNG